MEGTNMVEYGDQIALSFENKGCLKKVCDLNKSRTPMVATVMVDEYTQKASESFDYDFDGENKLIFYVLLAQAVVVKVYFPNTLGNKRNCVGIIQKAFYRTLTHPMTVLNA